MITDIEELLDSIYNEIRERNSAASYQPVPLSDEFTKYLADKYDLIPFTVPRLFKILVNSHRIFSFNVAEEDLPKKILKIEGYVVAEGVIIKKLKEYYEDELIRLYSIEYNKKLSAESAIRDFIPLMGKLNNTQIGRTGNMAVMLGQIEIRYERNILEYSSKWQEKQMQLELAGCEPVSYFIIDKEEGKEKNKKEKVSRPVLKKNSEPQNISDFEKYSRGNPIEKTLTVYGAEFYARVCFRDYKFSIIQGLIEKGMIKDRDDLLNIKKLLQKERSNADQDIKLQSFARDINNLEKCINNILLK